MSEYLLKVSEDEYNDKYRSLKDVTSLSTEEDVITFIDTFENSGVKGYNIIKVVEYNGRYVFVYSNKPTWYDFFTELNKLVGCNKDFVLSPLNVKQLYRGKSRGYFDVDEYSTEDTGTFDDDTPTGFMDEDDELMILFHKLTKSKIPLDETGIVIGRSSSKSDYVISNTNISREHARVFKRNGKCYIADLNSANGTFIGGLKIPKGSEREIREGDTIKLADEIFILKRGV